MKRRELIHGAVAGAAALATASLVGCGDRQPDAAAAPAVQTGKRVRWRLASSFPHALDTIYGGAETLAARVAAMTDGAFEIRLHPAGEIVPALQVMDAVEQGTVEVGHTASYYYIGKNPALAFDTCVPFGMTARQQNAWLDRQGGRTLVDELFSDFGIKTFGAGNTGAQMGGWFRREVPELSDLAGLKMRIPGLGGNVMSALGVTVQNLPGPDVYQALERGAIDATEWVGPYDDEKLGFHKIAKFYYYPGWWEPGPSLSFHVGRKAWQALPATYREVFQAAAAEAASGMQTRYDAQNPPALARLLASGTQLRRFSDEHMLAAREASQQLLSDQSAKDPAYAKVRDSWESARRESFGWFATSELAYAQFAFPT